MNAARSVYECMECVRRSSVVFLVVPLLAAAQQSANHRQPSPQAKHTPYAENGAVPMPDERAADSYAIYSMLVPGPVLDHMPPEQTQTWAIADTTVNTDDRNPAVPPQGQLKPPPGRTRAFEEAVGDFETNQQVRIHLTRRGFHIDHAFRLLTPSQIQDLRAARTSPAVASATQTEWSGYPGVTFFSEVYFNKKHTAALVYRSEWCAHLCSAGSWIYLEKQGDRWVQQSGIVVPGA